MSPGTGSGAPGPAPQDPQVITNPPGLSAISYRVDDFTGFRRALLRPLPGEQAISDWRPAPGDLGLQVLEWWAYLADVLTFYNERYANESYLGTATQPGSIANLVALIGYQPSPGTAATGTLAAVSSAGQSAEPMVIPAGMSLSSTASPGVPSQTFEVDARGHLHRAVRRSRRAPSGHHARPVPRQDGSPRIGPDRRAGERRQGRTTGSSWSTATSRGTTTTGRW